MTGIEPATSRATILRSNQLSYTRHTTLQSTWFSTSKRDINAILNKKSSPMIRLCCTTKFIFRHDVAKHNACEDCLFSRRQAYHLNKCINLQLNPLLTVTIPTICISSLNNQFIHTTRIGTYYAYKVTLKKVSVQI